MKSAAASGVLKRPRRCSAMTFPLRDAETPAVMRVSMNPGITAFTRTPLDPQRPAKSTVSPSKAAFAVEYAACPTAGWIAAWLEMKTTCPPPLSAIAGIAAIAHCLAALKFNPNTASHASSVMRASGTSSAAPAAQTSRSHGKAWKNASTAKVSERSRSFRPSFTTSRPASRKISAIAVPSPPVPPVIITRFNKATITRSKL